MTDNTDTTNGPNALRDETPLKFPARLAAVFVEPVRLLKEIAVKPDLTLPFIIFLVYIIVSNFFAALQVSETNLLENFQLDIVADKTFALFTAIFSGIILLISWLITAGILHLFTKFFDSEASFRHIFSLTGYARFISLVQSSIILVIFRFSGRQISFSPAAFLADQARLTSWGTFLSHLDLFSLFHLAFLALGFIHVCKISEKKSIGFVVFFWLASLALDIFFTVKVF